MVALAQKDKALEAKEAELQRKEAKLQGKEAAAATLTATLVQKDTVLAAQEFGTQRPPLRRGRPPCPCSGSRRMSRGFS